MKVAYVQSDVKLEELIFDPEYTVIPICGYNDNNKEHTVIITDNKTIKFLKKKYFVRNIKIYEPKVDSNRNMIYYRGRKQEDYMDGFVYLYGGSYYYIDLDENRGLICLSNNFKHSDVLLTILRYISRDDELYTFSTPC